ncbi:hypothetical protein KC343_g8044, partial [Hortaea werneckii]
MSSDGVADTEHSMQINPQRAQVLAENLSNVLQRVRLIAVSKLKTANDILALHEKPNGHLDFGENYAQELTEKA